MKKLYNYKVISVNRILDGDTVELTIDLGFNLTKVDRYRMAGYDACETYHPHNDVEKLAGLQTKAYLITLLDQYKDNLVVSTYKDTDIYGRYSGTIYSNDIDINALVLQYMIDNKLTKGDILK